VPIAVPLLPDAVSRGRTPLSPAARAPTQVLIGRLTRVAVLLATGVAGFIGVTVAREHPGAAARSAPPQPPPPFPHDGADDGADHDEARGDLGRDCGPVAPMTSMLRWELR